MGENAFKMKVNDLSCLHSAGLVAAQPDCPVLLSQGQQPTKKGCRAAKIPYRIKAL